MAHEMAVEVGSAPKMEPLANFLVEVLGTAAAGPVLPALSTPVATAAVPAPAPSTGSNDADVPAVELQNPHRCEHCGRGFVSLAALQQHQTSSHKCRDEILLAEQVNSACYIDLSALRTHRVSQKPQGTFLSPVV